MPVTDASGGQRLQALGRIGSNTCLAADYHRRISPKQLRDREVRTSEACPINGFAEGRLAEQVNKTMGVGNRVGKCLGLSRKRIGAVSVNMEDRSAGTSGCVFRI